MPWVPLQESGIGYYFDTAVQQGSPVYILEGSSVKTNGTQVRNWWELGFDENVMLRLTVASEHPSGYLYIEFYWEGGNQDNKTPEPEQSFTPEVIEAGPTSYLAFSAGSSIVEGTLSVLLEVWEGDDPDPGPEPGPSTGGYHVYELDRGWSFDGYYIPHFLELNWYFGDDPFTDKSIQKVRIHGLAKGRTQLQLAVAGMQHEYDSDYTEPQYIDLPRNAAFISTDYIPTTNYVDSSNWGVSLQLKFEGRNCDLMRPEPSHVLQVLALQGSPQENGRRIN